jgi:hypothetical protein
MAQTARSRHLAVVAGTALVVSTLLAGGQGSAASASGDAEAASQVDTSPAADAALAMTAAQRADVPVEDLSQRSETTKVFANPDGSWTAESSSGPVRTQDAEGRWHEIDTSLVPVDGGFEPRHAIGDLHVSDGGDKTFASLDVDGRDLAWRWPDSLPQPEISGSTATYPNAADGADLVVTATPSGFRQDIVLHEAPAEPISFSTPVLTSGPTVSETEDGGLAIQTRDGDELVTAPTPVMYDATEDASGAPLNVEPLATRVESTDTGAVITLDPSEEFLNDPATQYPVTVDPTYSSFASVDTWVSTSNTSAVHPWDPDLVVGTQNGGDYRYRSFLKFPTGPWDGKSVKSATLTLRNFDALTCAGSAIQVRRLVEAYNNGSTNWANQPSTITTGASNLSGSFGYSSACPSDNAVWNVTSIAQAWAGSAPNYGIRVAAVNEDWNSSFRKYRSADYDDAPGFEPKLVVNYNTIPATPSELAVSTLAEGFVTTITPTLSARVTDGDNTPLTATFKVWDDTDGAQIWSKSVTQTTANTTVSVSVPAGVTVLGHDYHFTVQSSDNIDSSPLKASSSFALDDDYPAAADGPLPAETSYGVDEYEVEDMTRVASQEGLSVADAVDRYAWEDDFADATSQVAEAFPDQFAIAAIEDSATPTATVQFKGDVPSGAESYFSNVDAAVALQPGAVYSAIEANDLVASVADSLTTEVSSEASFTVEYDEAANQIDAVVNDPEHSSSASLSAQSMLQGDAPVANADQPDVEITYVAEPVATSATLRGGVQITSSDSSCTTGFPAFARTSPRVYGIITADHCDNDATYYSSDTSTARFALKDASRFMAHKYGDAQFMPTDGEAVGKSFYYAVGKYRTLTGERQVNVGMHVCFFGRTSKNKSTCSTIDKVNVSVHYSNSNKSYSNLFRTKSNMGIKSGDSGGPAYWGGKAMGLVSGHGSSLLAGQYGLFSPTGATGIGMDVVVNADW